MRMHAHHNTQDQARQGGYFHEESAEYPPQDEVYHGYNYYHIQDVHSRYFYQMGGKFVKVNIRLNKCLSEETLCARISQKYILNFSSSSHFSKHNPCLNYD